MSYSIASSGYNRQLQLPTDYIRVTSTKEEKGLNI